MQLTLDIPDKLAVRIGAVQSGLPRILSLGLREFDAENLSGFKGLADILEFLASLPAPQEVLELRPSAVLREEAARLHEKSRDRGLNPEEEEQWRHIEYLEHLVRKAKIRAAQRLAEP